MIPSALARPEEPQSIPITRSPGRKPASRWLMPAASLALAGVVALTILVALPQYWWPSVRLVLAYLVTPVGQEIWLPLGHVEFGLPIPLVAALLLLVNASVALMACGLPVEDLLRKVPRVGARVARFGEKVRNHRLARRGLAVALAVVIALPIHTGGAVVGSLAGRFVGLSPMRAFAAVMAGVSIRLLVALLAVQGFAAIHPF